MVPTDESIVLLIVSMAGPTCDQLRLVSEGCTTRSARFGGNKPSSCRYKE